jgi:tetratricopeptide (TPR) repeat protein
MAEGAGSEGRRGPPPLPPDVVGTPAAAGVVAVAVPLGDSVRHGSSPPGTGTIDPGPFVELAALLAREAEASSDPKRRADLLVRLALLFWDVLDDPEAAERYLVAVGADHPSALRLRLALALAQRDDGDLQALYDEMRAAPAGSSGVRPLELEFAEIWLFRQGDPERAAACCRELLSRAPGDREGRELLALALAARKQWAELSRHLSDAPAEDAEALGDAARLVLDGGGEVTRAAALAGGVLERPEGRETVATQLHAIELLLELAALGAADPAPLYERKLALIGDDARAAAERAATLYRSAELRESADPEAAREIYARLALEAAPFGARLALLARRRAAARRDDWSEVAEALRDLGRGAGLPALSRAYLRRAAEVLETRVGDAARAEEAWAELSAADPGDVAAARALERLRLGRGAWAELVAQEEAHARARLEARGRSLARAAMILEVRSGDLEGAARLRRESLSSAAGGGGNEVAASELQALEDLARLYRRIGDRVRLGGVYRREAQLRERLAQARAGSESGTADVRGAAALFAAIGALQLQQGHYREAEEFLQQAVERAADDLFARAALAWIYRRTNRHRELATALGELVRLVSTDAARAVYWRELGRVASERLGDATVARQAFEQALELSPGDAGALHALARLCGEAGDYARAVELRDRAVAASGESVRASAILMEIGEICEKHLHDDERARAAYERALELDPDAVGALRALAQLHRKARRLPELLDVLRRELATDQEPARRVTLHLEIARHEDALGGPANTAAIEHYRGALALDPASAPALAGLERICRRDGRWDELVTAVKGAPRTARTTRSLAEALEKLERWQDLAEVRKLELELLQDPREGARTAAALGLLYEERLGDPEQAARLYRRAMELDPEDVHAVRALARLYEARGRFAELPFALEQELARTADRERKLAILAQLGDVRRARLEQPEEAARAYEQLLAIEPNHLGALRALGELYSRLSRQEDLARVLDSTAQAVGDSGSRAEVLIRKGELAEARGDWDAAVASLREAFLADPASRTAFTTLERICYKRERWREAMELYDSAIQLVESGACRAYRLADLYARRGQLQLTYLGQPGEAAASYLRVLELEPENDTALKYLETIFSQQGDWRGLIAAYEQRAEILGVGAEEKRVETLRRAARVAAAKLKDNQEAARLYARIHQIDPADGEALDALERYYERAREFDKLVEVLRTRLQLAADSQEATGLHLRIAGICEEGLRDIDSAIASLQSVLEIDAQHKDALDALARIYEGTERWTEFVEVTRRQIKVVQDRQQKALLYFKCGSVMEAKFDKDDDAIRYYDAAIKTSPSCLPAVHGLRDLYLRRHDWQRVIQTLELEVKLWQEDKERAGVFARIGQIYMDSMGELERAVHYFESALTVDPECQPANRALFDLYFQRGDWEHALPLSNILAQKAGREGDPAERSEFYRKRGVTQRETGDTRGAAESLVIALEIKPDNLEALDALAGLCRMVPDAYDFATTFRELEKIYRRRDDRKALARVLIVTGTLAQAEYDLATAESAFREAIALDPDELSIVLPLADLLIALRQFTDAVGVIEALLARNPPGPTRVQAQLHLADIWSDCLMDPGRSAAALRELLRLEPQHPEGNYRLAQELYLLGRFPEAQRTMERLIELAAAPDDTASPEELARYYYYLGRILEAQGDAKAASSDYRRAAEYDPAFPPPQLALAKRAAASGDRQGAEAILNGAAAAASERDPLGALTLARGLAQVQLAADDRAAAIAAYRSIIDGLGGGALAGDDRVALAEVLARDSQDLPAAIDELARVLEHDLRHAPTYRLLVVLYDKLGERERVARVLTILDMLGYAEDVERTYLSNLRARLQMGQRLGALSDALRAQYLVPREAQGRLAEVFALVREQLQALYPLPYVGENPRAVDDAELTAATQDLRRLFGINAEVLVADGVPGGVLGYDVRQPVAVIDRSYADRPIAERRFALGRAFDPLRGGYGLLLRLSPQERADVGELLGQLLRPESQREAATVEFVRALPRKVQKALERLAGGGEAEDPASWMAALAKTADRAGLVACDDVAAASRLLVAIGGSNLLAGEGGAVALGAVPGGVDLVRYYLGEDYHRLRAMLSQEGGRL